ncbi:DUF1810 domain-containing protein [Methylopila turkensis]|uniref:Calpastatin n=1 Tax=Methylopila turkensis TaxID=1437816 RepID=A0A9W6JQG8_9HYPH|nr:DUF1810 domain-containing protein [Methylopila turkensis]GLK80105.1 hypothetical protein GCM10008174_18460 [Methylopila turkensis]
MGEDPYDLSRFASAQDGVFERALVELEAGRKTGHWMWFVFPQLRGLGASPAAHFYGLSSIAEARAYLGHPVLGPRLIRCTQTVLGVEGRTLHEIFGSPDDLKFRSSMTLFELAAAGEDIPFSTAIAVLCEAQRDQRTLQLVEAR